MEKKTQNEENSKWKKVELDGTSTELLSSHKVAILTEAPVTNE